MSRPRISAISFLNTAPLMWDFEHTGLGAKYETSYTIPSLCAEALRAGAADIGLIPAVTYLTMPDLTIIPGVAIASLDRVRSILLVSRKPLEEIKTVAADTSSRTSVVLCDLLFRMHFAPHRDGSRVRQFTRHEPELDAMLARFDAALLIGDSALRVDAPGYLVFDLAHEWRAMTGKPFCFAFWAARRSIVSPKMTAHFGASRDHGLEPASLDVLAREWAPRVGISEAGVRSYLSENIYYNLDRDILDGLAKFFELGRKEQLLPAESPNELPVASAAR